MGLIVIEYFKTVIFFPLKCFYYLAKWVTFLISKISIIQHHTEKKEVCAFLNHRSLNRIQQTIKINSIDANC